MAVQWLGYFHSGCSPPVAMRPEARMSSTTAAGGHGRCGLPFCILLARAVARQQDFRSFSWLKLEACSQVIRSAAPVAVNVAPSIVWYSKVEAIIRAAPKEALAAFRDMLHAVQLDPGKWNVELESWRRGRDCPASAGPCRCAGLRPGC